MKVKNLLNWAEFNKNNYLPTTFRDMLVNTAQSTYDMYVNNRIISFVGELPSPQDVRDSFDESISNYLKGAAFDDENYERISDDLMLLVYENNVKLLKESV
jgi:hypothetical protein